MVERELALPLATAAAREHLGRMEAAGMLQGMSQPERLQLQDQLVDRELASRLGIPVSTTHTISTSIMGVGAARKLTSVRWGVVREVVAAWILTFPVCAIIGWLIAFLARLIGG